MIETIGHLNNAGMKPLFVLAYMPCLLKTLQELKDSGAKEIITCNPHKSNNIDISDLLII
jgi:hypothetical protein